MSVSKHFFIPVFVLMIFTNCEKSKDPLSSEPDKAALDLSIYENQYRLVYVHNLEIYAIDSDGKNLKRLTENNFYDHTPTWSPSGLEIIFTSFRPDYNSINIYKMNIDGSNQTNLSSSDCSCADPEISSDGLRVVYTQHCDSDSFSSLMLMNIDGSGKKKLIDMFTLHEPTWSFDGRKILFYGSDLVSSYIFVIDPAGENLLQLTDTSGRDYNPSWSPNGDRIVYTSCRDDNCEIYIMDPDGSNKQNLTNHPAWDHFASWSSDGLSILFHSNRGGDKDIYMINLDGSGLKNITDDSYDTYYFPTSSPDGTRISYSVNTDGDDTNDTIFIMDKETGKYQKLTEGWTSPQWGSRWNKKRDLTEF